MYRQHKYQAKEYTLAAFTISDGVAVIDRRPFDSPLQHKLFQSTAEKQKETGPAQNGFRRGSKVAPQRKRRQFGQTSWKIQQNQIKWRAGARTLLSINHARSTK